MTALRIHVIICLLVCFFFLVATFSGWHLPKSSGGGYGVGVGRGYGGSWGGGK